MFSNKDFFRKYDQIRSFLQTSFFVLLIWNLSSLSCITYKMKHLLLLDIFKFSLFGSEVSSSVNSEELEKEQMKNLGLDWYFFLIERFMVKYR